MGELADLLERFRRGGELVAVVTTGAAGPELDFHAAPGKWSIRELVCHLADSEIVAVQRLRGIIAEENPALTAWDQEAWTKNLDYSRRKYSQAIETFRRIRGENYDLLNGLPETAFERVGTHSVRGRLTLLDLLRLCAEHAENHARQIQQIRQAYKQAKAQAVR